MSTVVAVAGASGYAGGEVLRLIAGHPNLELGPVTAASHAGALVTSVHPSLTGIVHGTFVVTDGSALREADVVVMALPHGESAALVSQLPSTMPVVDLGADFRLRSAHAWTSYYGGEHAGTWEYGLPELPGRRTMIAESSRVANPGCYATAVALSLAPLVQSALIDTSDVVIVAASGTSGAGRKATESLLASEVMGSMSAYKVGGSHQHTPEMEQTLAALTSEPVTLSFTPLLAPMSRGILATCTARGVEHADAEQIRAAMHDAYAHEPFVHVLPEGVWPRTADTLGSNAVHIQVASDHHSRRVVVIAAIDNLVKGAAGQAVQNLNLMLGFPETQGLPMGGIAP